MQKKIIKVPKKPIKFQNLPQNRPNLYTRNVKNFTKPSLFSLSRNWLNKKKHRLQKERKSLPKT